MKISFKKQDMINSLNIVTKALPEKATSNILECILIESNKGNIILTATNQEITIKTKAIGKIEEEGIVAINGKKLDQLIKKLPENDNDIFLTVDNDYNCKFIYGKNKNFMEIQGKSIETFPKTVNIDKKNVVFILEYALKKLLEKTIFAVSKDQKEDQKILTGVYFNIEGTKMILKAVDGYKIAIVKYDLSEKYEKKECIIPGSTIEQIIKIIKGEVDKEVKIYFNENSVTFEIENSVIISNIIQGNFLNTDKIINTEYTTNIKVEKDKLYESIDRTRIFINEIEKKPVIIDVKANNMQVRLESLEGKVNDNIDIEKTGNDIMIAFNQNTFLSILNVIEEEKINIFMTTSKHPVFIKDEKETYFYFLLPTSF